MSETPPYINAAIEGVADSREEKLTFGLCHLVVKTGATGLYNEGGNYSLYGRAGTNFHNVHPISEKDAESIEKLVVPFTMPENIPLVTENKKTVSAQAFIPRAIIFNDGRVFIADWVLERSSESDIPYTSGMSQIISGAGYLLGEI